MKKLIIILAIVSMLITPLAAKQKSAAKAMLFSALVPGTGQAYLGSYTKAGVFLATELLTLGAAFRLSQEVQWAENSYEQFALSKTGAALGSDKDYYQKLQNYISSDEYNEEMQHDAWAYYVLIYNDLDSYHKYVEQYYIDEDLAWDWVTNETWQEYRSKRRYRQDIKTYSNLAVAAVVLNHLVGLIDTSLTNAALKKKSRHQGRVYVNPDFERKGIGLGYAFKF